MLLDDLLGHIGGATIFSKPSRHLSRLYEWTVMPSPLSNDRSIFMCMMNKLFRPFIGKLLVVYFDDILIYSANFEVHLNHLKEVISLLQENKFYGALNKCAFMKDGVLFLGYMVLKDGISVDESKMQAIKQWPILTSIHAVCSIHC